MEEKDSFNKLNAVDLSGKTETKGKLTYLPWSSAWAEVKKRYPDASFKVYPQIIDATGNTRFWHDDGRSGWVEVGVTIDGFEIIETLAIMDYRNEAIAAEKITSVEANKSMKRCLTKACAMHGLGLYIYDGEELPEEVAKTSELKNSIVSLIQKKCALSDKAKARVEELCKAAEKKAFPDMDEELIKGNPRNIDDFGILNDLYKRLLTVRK